MFSFGLANFLSLSDRMSDMLKKFSTSLNENEKIILQSISACTTLSPIFLQDDAPAAERVQPARENTYVRVYGNMRSLINY